jgi:protein-S-isoprenylcysteine O-methyltransferase Ste14
MNPHLLGKLWVALQFGLLAVLIPKARLEERWLVLRYPDYQAYPKCTWRLFPWIY